MANHYTILTDVGATKVANALRSGSRIEIREMALGDGNGALPQPDGGAKALVNERYRAQINSATVDAKNDAWVIFEQVLAPDVGGWWIREVALYDTDGDLIAIGNYPEQYKPLLTEGASTTQTVRVVIQVLSSAAITLNVDPAVVLATRKDLESAVQGLEDRKASKDELNKAIEGLGVQAAARMTHSDAPLANLAGSKTEVADTAQLVEVRKLIDALVPAGTVIHVAMSNAPEGYLAANGTAVSRETYARLFAAIGTTFGGGDGATTFNLPDLRGEFIRGWDNGRGVDGGRQLGSWQRGTLVGGYDDWGNTDVFSLSNHGTKDYGSDKINWDDYSDAETYYHSVGNIYGQNSKSSGGYSVTRPRNTALLACIKF
ncbi:phage tail protein [Zymobacter palmae]|uniref:Phage-related tail fibre protein n=1 Tax=Zymobacter palmae TaxID=33074 RepID=A0A348HHI3_9GAMM|nr:phage tail protein [Zymobacter palmae]BBG31085.1 phage-related tail fibre protein [Zymobacter palmae]